MIWNKRQIMLLLIIENKMKEREREKINFIYLAFLAVVALVVLLADAGALSAAAGRPFFVCLATVGSSSGAFSTSSFVRSSSGSSV